MKLPSYVFADNVKVEGNRIPRELGERMTGGERLRTKSINTKVVSVDYHYIYCWNLNKPVGCMNKSLSTRVVIRWLIIRS